MANAETGQSEGLVLYHCPQTRSFRVLWMLEEIGVPYALRVVDIRKGEQKLPDYLALNPSGKVPCLVDGDAVIPESAAICAYLADKFPKARLAPTLESPKRGEYLRWMFYSVGVVEPVMVDHWLKRESPATNVAWGDFETFLGVLSPAIGRERYLLGDWFTAADIMIGSAVQFGLAAKVLPERPEFTGYVELLGARPALRRAQAADRPEAPVAAQPARS